MKILYINTVANTGSTGRIVTLLYHYVKTQGMESQVAYGRGRCDAEVESYKIGSKVDFIRHVLKNFFCGESGFGSTKQTKHLVEYIKKENPDIIHLHNIHGFYLNCEILFNYFRQANISIIWTLHDCWPFTGHCAYFDYIKCEKWKTGCSKCPQFRTAYPYSIFKDNSKNSYAKKRELFRGIKDLTIVTPSFWLASIVKQSFLNEYPIEVIHNGIDLEHFYMQERSNTIASTKKVVLGVANVWEKRKGLKYFEILADHLDENYVIMLVGLNQFQRKQLSKKYSNNKVIPLGKTENVEQLCEIYSQATVYVNPTLEDNYPTTNMEALACGTPIVTFDTGGCRECMNYKCGIVVEKKNWKELVAAVETICNSAQDERNYCIEWAKQFDANVVSMQYFSLYKRILKQ